MENMESRRRAFLLTASSIMAGGIAGCSSTNESETTPEPTATQTSMDTPTATTEPTEEPTETPQGPTTGEVIETWEDEYTVGTYEQPDNMDSVEDAQYLGRGSIPVLLPHTAQVEYTIDLSVQEGYDTIPLNFYFVDAANYLYLQQVPTADDFETIAAGTQEGIEDTASFSFTSDPGVYFLLFESATVGRESEFGIEFEARQYLNADDGCLDAELNVPLLTLEHVDTTLNVESWDAYYHIQYGGEAGTTYQSEVTFISSDDEETITQTQTQIEDCETNFVYLDRITMNVVEMGESIQAEIKIFDEAGEELLAEDSGEIGYITDTSG